MSLRKGLVRGTKLSKGQIKSFKILAERFRHGVEKHKVVFEAVFVIVQYEMEDGHPISDV